MENIRKPRSHLAIWLIIVSYFVINGLLSIWISKTANVDQAEQLFLSQSFAWGYNAQPPLYTYLAMSLFRCFGTNLISLYLLKASLLSITSGAFILIGRKLNFSTTQHLIALSGLFLIPQYVWESQRDLTHSVLCTSIAAITIWQIFRLKTTDNWINHGLLGVAIALGILSKYSFILLSVALFLAILVTKEYRRLLLSKKSLLTYGMMTLILLPHAYWFYQHLDITSHITAKLEIQAVQTLSSTIKGLGYALLSALAFITPLWLFAIPLLFRSKHCSNKSNNSSAYANIKLLMWAAIFSINLVLLVAIVTGAQEIKDRWYQPLLFYIPIIIAFYAKNTRTLAAKLFISTAVCISILVAIALPLRVIKADSLKIYDRPNMPYPEILKAIRSSSSFYPDFILAENKLLAGNAKLIFKDTIVRTKVHSLNPISLSGKGLIVCESIDCEKLAMKDSLLNCITANSTASEKYYHHLELPYRYSKEKSLEVFWVPIDIKRCSI